MFESLDLERLFENFNQQKILIIGDVMIDAYMWGKVRRISPEAPVPVVSDIFEEKRLGGAANVALNIKAMGAVPILCSVIGNDLRGKQFLDLLNEQNLSDIGLVMDPFQVTTQKTRVISGTQHLLRVDEESEEEISLSTQTKLIDFIKDIIEDGNINSIIIQDYDKGVLTENLIKEVTALATRIDLPVLVDPKRKNFLNYENISLFKPNFKELVEGLKSDIDKNNLEQIAGLMQDFRKMKSHKMVLVTLSEMGVIINNEEEYNHIAAEIRDIADVSGAGDTVISIAALCLGEGLSPLDIAGLSNLAGGQVCEKAGVVSVNRYQLLEEALQIQQEEVDEVE
jgi:rfaE bifunctional protein kinase chain/domain